MEQSNENIAKLAREAFAEFDKKGSGRIEQKVNLGSVQSIH